MTALKHPIRHDPMLRMADSIGSDEDDEMAEEGHLTPEHYKKMTFTDYPGRDVSYVHQALTHREPHYMKSLTDDVRRNGIRHPIEIAHHDNDEWEVGGGHHRAAVAWHLGLTAPYVRTQEHGDWDPGEKYHEQNTKWRERRKEHPEEQQAYMRRGEADDPFKGKWAARFTPTKRIFAATCGLDHRLFDERQKLRPEVRSYVMSSISQFFRSYGEHYRDWAHWCRVYFAGSEASEWTSESLEGNNDFDVLLGIEYDRFRAATGSTQTDQQITDELNAALHADSTTWMDEVWIRLPLGSSTWPRHSNSISNGPSIATEMTGSPRRQSPSSQRSMSQRSAAHSTWQESPATPLGPRAKDGNRLGRPVSAADAKSLRRTRTEVEAARHGVSRVDADTNATGSFDASMGSPLSSTRPCSSRKEAAARSAETPNDSTSTMTTNAARDRGLAGSASGESFAPDTTGHLAGSEKITSLPLFVISPERAPSIPLPEGWIWTGPWSRTTYINPQSWDIRRIKPYAAYEVGEGRWVVKPPHLPHWSLSDFPKTVVATLRAAETYAKSVLKLPEPERTQQGAALFTAWHEDRSRAFSERGQGWFDIANLREKWMDQEGLWAQLVDCAHRAKEGLDLAAVDWSNTPPGYTASLPKTQKCKYCDKQATKRVIHSEGMAYIPACPDHLDKAKADAAKSVPYGEPDPSNINAIRPIAVTMPYIRNNSGMRQHAPSGFGQEHEPWGRYMSPHQGHVPEGWEHGSVDFDNPLHVEHNGGEWKQQLSEQHGGATGKDLSRALLVKGHDAVITHDQHGIGEMVDLRPRGQRGHRVEAAYADYVRDAWNRKAEQPEWDEKTKAQFRQNGEEDYRYHSGTTKHHQGDDWPGVGWVKTDKIAQYRDRDPDKPEHWLGGKGGSSERIINSLREGFRNGEGWEHPIQLHYHPGSNTTWMGEGNHRLRAAELEGHTHVPVTVRLDRHRPNQGKPFEGEAKHDFQLPEEDNGRIHPKHLLPSDWLASEQHKTARGGPVEATQTKTVMITPMLFVGAEIPPGLQHWKRVSSPQEALSATEAGYTAILPPNAWMAVLTVLQAWGVSRRDAEDRIRFVRGQ